jgi:hypothetical protein
LTEDTHLSDLYFSSKLGHGCSTDFETRLRSMEAHSSFKKLGRAQSPHLNSTRLLFDGPPRNSRNSESLNSIHGLHNNSRNHDDVSRVSESRSLLAKVKDDFKRLTNRDSSGVPARDHDRVVLDFEYLAGKPKAMVIKQTNRDTNKGAARDVVGFLKQEFNSRMNTEAREKGSSGTLSNLFSILKKERLNSLNTSNRVSEVRCNDKTRISINERKSSVVKDSSTMLIEAKGEEIVRGLKLKTDFPGELVTKLCSRLKRVKREQLDEEKIKALMELQNNIESIINLKSN